MISGRDAERLLLGAGLQGVQMFEMILSNGIGESSFSDSVHKKIFASMERLHVSGREPVALSVTAENPKDEVLNNNVHAIIQELSSLQQLSDFNSCIQYLHAEQKRREAIERIHAVHTKILESGVDVAEAIEAAAAELLKISGMAELKIVALRTAVELASAEIDDEAAGKKKAYRSDSLQNLNSITGGGFRSGRLYAIGASAKVGKSLLCGQLALEVGRHGESAGIVSMEMKETEIVFRYAGIHQTDSLAEKKRKIDSFKQEARAIPLYIRSGGNSSKSLFSVMRQLLHRKTQFFIVDYLQLVQLLEKKQNAVEELNAIVSGLKAFAIENDACIILVCALLTKNIEGRFTKRPNRGDIVGSGRVVNDVDVLLLMHLPDDNDSKYVEIFVEAGRNGESGTAALLLGDDLLFRETEPRKSDSTIAGKSKTSYSGVF